jgi:hypothetical protein
VEVDLGSEHNISKMEIHGRGLHGQYLKKFELQYRVNPGAAYTVLKPLEGDAMNQFTAVGDQHAMKILSNFEPFSARFVRLMPREFNSAPAFKWELHGYGVLNA